MVWTSSLAQSEAEGPLRREQPRDPPPLRSHRDFRISVPEGYVESRTEHFLFVYPARGESRARELIEMAEPVRVELTSVIGVDPPGVTRVYLAANTEDFMRMQPGGNKLSSWVAGVAYGSLNVVILRQAGSRGQPINLTQTFKHEMSHIILRGAVGDTRLPRWFVEGLAQWQARQFDLERNLRLAGASMTGRLMSLEELMGLFPSGMTEVQLAYDESFEFINFLVGEFGKRKFRELIRRLGRREAFFEALKATYDLPIEELEEKWLAAIRMDYSWLPLITSGAAVWTAASFIFLLSYLRRRRDKAKRMAEWEEEERLADGFLAPVAGKGRESGGGGEAETDKAAGGNGDPRRSREPKGWMH